MAADLWGVIGALAALLLPLALAGWLLGLDDRRERRRSRRQAADSHGKMPR
jgi:hypothetical protein